MEREASAEATFYRSMPRSAIAGILRIAKNAKIAKLGPSV